MGIGHGSGDNAAGMAAEAAIKSPLLETSIEGAKGVLLNITGGNNLGLLEVNEAAEVVADAVDPDANIIFGAVIDERLKDEVRVTVIATGVDEKVVSTDRSSKGNVKGPLDELVAKPVVESFKMKDLEIPSWMRRG